MNAQPVLDQRAIVREFERKVAAAGSGLDRNMLVEGLEELLGMQFFQTPRTAEELATRLGSCAHAAVPIFAELADDVLHPHELRSLSGMAAAIGYRRSGMPSESDAVLDRLADLDPVWPYFRALILHLRSINRLGSDPEKIREGVMLSREANRLVENSSGFMHALAHLLLEEGIWSAMPASRRAELWREALDLVERAIALGDWPKFHYTRGRLLLRLGTTEADTVAAMTALRRAAQSDSKSAFDSGERRLEYALELSLAELRVVLREGQDEIDSRLEAEYQKLERRSAETARELEEKLLAESRTAQNQAITVVGFVVVALSLLPLSTSIFGFVESLGLPMVLLGIAAYAAVMFGAVALGTWNLNRGLRRALDNLNSTYPSARPGWLRK